LKYFWYRYASKHMIWVPRRL